MFEEADSCLQEEKSALVASRDNLDRLYRDSSNSLTILERSHRFTMEELDNQGTACFQEVHRPGARDRSVGCQSC
jgi:hypothetical protein